MTATIRLPDLPRPASSRLAVRVMPDARRRLLAGHPWLYDGSIRSVSRDGAPGDLAVVFDDDRRFVAIGLWDPASPIRLKVLHAGRPATVDAAWWRTRLADASERRRPLFETAGTERATTGFRVVHGENDGLPGLVVDRYGEAAVVKLYSAAWIPHLADVVTALCELLAPRTIVLRLARTLREQPTFGLTDGTVIAGDDVTGPEVFQEAGLEFEADLVHGQKTGHFLDQRDNRIRVGELASGRRVLDVFCCTGGFSVHAAAGGAHVVHSVDASPGAIETARRNMARNEARPAVRACEHRTTVSDAFEELERLGRAKRRYDLVIVDPPSFAQNAASVPRAIAAYERLTTLALGVLGRDGVLVQASCSSRVGAPDFFRAVHAAASRAGADLEEIERTGHPLDHPVTFAEGAYLKALYARIPGRAAARVAAPAHAPRRA